MIAAAWDTTKTSPVKKTGDSFPLEESVAMWALTLSPPLTALAAMLTTGAYVTRYTLPASLGLAWLYAIFAHGCTQRRRRTAWVVTGIVAASFVVQGVIRGADLVTGYMHGFQTGSTFVSMEKLKLASHLPIVVTAPLEYFVFQHYAPERWRSRLVYVSDAERCLQVANFNTPDVGLSLFTQWAPLRVVQRSEYLSRGQDFLVLDVKGVTWPPDCRKFDAKNLVRLEETNEFVLYRWTASLEAGLVDEPPLQSKRGAPSGSF